MTGFKLRADYAAYYKLQGEQPPPPERPYLLGLTRQEARPQAGAPAGKVFAYTPPIFGFTPEEQELLTLALQGFSDDETALRLRLSREAVEKRWAMLCAWAGAKRPALLPLQEGDTRGSQQRRLLLNYLREHPEELRPIVPRR